MPGDFKRIGVKVPPTASAREAMAVAFDVLSTGARQAGASFREPDDDWRPMWLILTKSQGTLVSGDGDKYAMVDYVAQLARRFGAVAVGHLHSSWMIDAETAGSQEALDLLIQIARDRDGSTEGLPRREIVMIALHSAAVTHQYHARIDRSDDAPPTLGAFELVADSSEDGMRFEGAMIDPIVDALKTTG